MSKTTSKTIIIALLFCSSLWLSSQAADEGVTSFSYQNVIDQRSVQPEAATPPSQSMAQPLEGGQTVLISDSGKNLSDMEFTLYSAIADFGGAGLGVGEAVKFTAPTPDWMLKSLLIVGWSGFNHTSGRLPPDRNFLIEVRDDEANLLYKFADTQNFYFGSADGPVAYGMDVPSVPVTKDFYVVFYDRGSMYLGAEQSNGTGNSYLAIDGQLIPAEVKIRETNETVKVNWLIRAIGG